jgi:putative spermidine/putrescine transport system permease protein
MARRRWNWLILPMLVAFGLIYLPAILSFVLISFHESAGLGRVGDAWTLDNYGKILTDPVYLTGLGRSVALGLITVLGALVLGFPLAYYISRHSSRFALAVFTLLYVSSLTSIVIRGLGWITLLSNTGPINRALISVGITAEPITFQGDLLGLSIAMIHYTLPYMVLTLLPVMHAIPTGLEEASEGLGAGFLTTIRAVVLPLAMPGILAGSLLVFAMTISAFVIPRLIGGTTLRLASLLIDQQMRITFNYALGSTLASILLLLVGVVVVLANVIGVRRVAR